MRAASAEPHRRPHLAGEALAGSGQRGAASRNEELGDMRFCALIPPQAWASLSEPIRRRFSRRLGGGRAIVFIGEVTESRMSVAGWLLAQTARLFGAPFSTSTDTSVPSVVSVTEDFASGGQMWTRLYARRTTFPQVIHSSKQFSGPTGLEEHVVGGLGMTLTLHVEKGALVFRSDRYFIRVFGIRLWLPAALTPGRLSVTHMECGDGRFSFALDVTHPRLGQLICQRAFFREIAP